LLLTTFSSVKKIKALPKETLENLIGPAKSALLMNHFSKG
jgi:hypothetical protein